MIYQIILNKKLHTFAQLLVLCITKRGIPVFHAHLYPLLVTYPLGCVTAFLHYSEEEAR